MRSSGWRLHPPINLLCSPKSSLDCEKVKLPLNAGPFTVLNGRVELAGGVGLERLKKFCSHADGEKERAVFLGFGFVSAQLQGFTNLRLRRSLAKTPKNLPPRGNRI